MAFSEQIKKQALKRAGNRCECKLPSHEDENQGRCNHSWDLEVHHILAVAAGGKDTLENCQVLCYVCRDRSHRDQRPRLIVVRAPVAHCAPVNPLHTPFLHHHHSKHIGAECRGGREIRSNALLMN